MNKLIRILQVIFSQTPEDKQRRAIDRYISIISHHHPDATEATSNWVLIRGNSSDSLRKTLDRNAVRLGAYWVGMMHMVNTMDYLIYMDVPGEDEPICVYENKWTAPGPWQTEAPILLQRTSVDVHDLPTPEEREQQAHRARAARAAEQFANN